MLGQTSQVISCSSSPSSESSNEFEDEMIECASDNNDDNLIPMKVKQYSSAPHTSQQPCILTLQ